jgi:hypothetical protein
MAKPLFSHCSAIVKGSDKLVDLYEVTEKLKKFNEILNEVGGSL